VPHALPPIIARAARFGPGTAIISNDRRYSYDDLDRSSAHAAVRMLEAAGPSLPSLDLAEARVAFLAAPGFAHIALQWGIWRAGGIAVPLPVSHPAAELDYLIRDSGASLVIADADNAERVAPLARASHATFRVIDEVVVEENVRPSVLPLANVAPTRRAMIVYTSGTTNQPKGVVTTHAHVTAQIESLVAAWEWSETDRTLLVLPLHHVHGIINVVCSALWSGALLEIHPRFDPDATWQRLASGEVTVFTAVPTIYHRLIQSWDSAPPDLRRQRSDGCRRMRLMMSGSAALPRTVLERWRDISGHVLLERYGMTEVGMALSNPLHGERRPGYVGQPLPGVSARLVDGELHLRGPGVFSEYWHRPDVTRESFVDGWFRTGDIAVVEDGAYRLLGRSSVDIIKTGGDKISALEIEEVLRTHPAIAECAVIGVEDEEWGQRVCCAAELKPGCRVELHELREWARSRLASHKIPKDLACVPRLPRNAMGKVVKPEVTAFFVQPVPPERPGS
jgi:malonyl-CoA/methylmalonyl-CoA synthetase